MMKNVLLYKILIFMTSLSLYANDLTVYYDDTTINNFGTVNLGVLDPSEQHEFVLELENTSHQTEMAIENIFTDGTDAVFRVLEVPTLLRKNRPQSLAIQFEIMTKGGFTGSIIIDTETGYRFEILVYGEGDEGKIGGSLPPVSPDEKNESQNDTAAVSSPAKFGLQNFPNPFNPSTTVQYSTERTVPVMITVHSIDGKQLATLVNATKSAGTHRTKWYGKNNSGQPVAGGTYFIKMTTPEKSEILCVTLVK